MSDNATLNARRLAATPRGVATATTIFADRAENAELWDVEGRRYIDFAGGIAVVNTGHRNPKVMGHVERQMARFTHTAYQVGTVTIGSTSLTRPPVMVGMGRVLLGAGFLRDRVVRFDPRNREFKVVE